MRFVVVGLMTSVALGCTTPNPRSCADGVCSDPAFPFCDTRGSLGGAVNECVAVTCAPGEFAECRGDVAITCNAEGTNYDVQQCESGCAAETHGCALDPSNGLGAYFDMVTDPPDLDLVAATIDTHTGTIDGVVSAPSFLLPALSGGVPIRVFVVRRAHFTNVTVSSSATSSSHAALAVIAAEEITIDGRLRATFSSWGAPGSMQDEHLCVGGPPRIGFATVNQQNFAAVTGGGGGGHASPGAPGGNLDFGTSYNPGGAAGLVAGTPELVPLQGGCSSGAWTNARGFGRGGHGGGAIQLSAMSRIRVLGKIDVRGEPGGTLSGFDTQNDVDYWVIAGGGAGGGLLLEAPVVELANEAKLLAGGGGGASRETDGQDTEDAIHYGGSCSLPYCGVGGNGASVEANAMPGASVTYEVTSNPFSAGGGGGGVGRVRINTRDGSFVLGPDTRIAAVSTTGVIRRR